MTLNRRAVLAALGAAAVTGRADAQADAEVAAALDAARGLPPAVGLRQLAGLRASSHAAALDLGAARSGLAIDSALTRFPDYDEQRRLLTQARDDGRPGALHLPGGADWYALQLRRQLGDHADPARAERDLQARLAVLQRRAAPLFDALGVPAGASGARFSHLWRDAGELYPDSTAGRDMAVADMNVMLAAAKARVAESLGPLPTMCLDVAVRRLSPAEEAAGKGGYRDLPATGRPGAYVVDLRDIRRRPRWTLPAVVAHELLPGHMAQLPIEAQTPPHPLRIDYAAAFVEGWGIHAEVLADRAGMYREPRAHLGHLHWLIFRTGRALADLGIHRHGWSLAQARARLVAWQGEPAYFAPFDVDLARIAVEPGVRTAEALAWLALDARATRHASARLAAHQHATLAGGRKRLEQLP